MSTSAGGTAPEPADLTHICGPDGHTLDLSHEFEHHHGQSEQLASTWDAPKSGPAQMSTRQRKYGQKLRGRFGAIAAEIRRGIIERDIFGLKESSGTERLASDFNPDDLTPSGFRFGDDARNHRMFMAWLREQERQGVLSAISRGDNVYVRRAADDGVRWADQQLRKKGFDVPTSGPDVNVTFNAPVNANKLRLLYERNFDLLEGITTDVAKEISRTLSEGLSQGQNPRTIARTLTGRIDSVGKYRATVMARHEIMYAHNEFAKDRFQRFDVERVKILGSSPCPVCQPYVDNIYPLDDLPQGGPPFHPQCVGSLSPVV